MIATSVWCMFVAWSVLEHGHEPVQAIPLVYVIVALLLAVWWDMRQL